MNTPSPDPSKYGPSRTEALDGVLIVIDGPGDTTRRPRRPDIPLTPPGRPPLPPKPEEGNGPTAG